MRVLGEDPKRMVTVCAECLTAACWHGEFYCQRYKEADVVELPRFVLAKIRLEHPDNFSDAKLYEVTGEEVLGDGEVGP